MTRERLATHVIPPEGNIQAKMLFVGEAPGAEEDAAGRPFIGSAGHRLTQCFNQLDILREEVLLHNIFQQRPPNNDVGYYFHDKMKRKPTWEAEEHIAAFRDWLVKLKADGHLRVIVALGATATYILTGKRRIKKWRGSVLECTLVPGLKVYATYHPSYVNRLMQEQTEQLQGERKKQQQNVLPIFLIDLQRAKEQSEFPEIRRPERNFFIGCSHGELLTRLKALNHSSLVAVDIETLPSEDGPLLWCIGFAPEPDYAFVVPFIEAGKTAWPLSQEAQLHQAISEVFLNPNVRKVFQGGAYDLSILGRYYGYRLDSSQNHEDTMLCHHASYPYIPKGLETLCSIYTWEPYYKDEGRVELGKSRGSDVAEFRYNAKDCCTTREILPIVERRARELRTYDGYRRSMHVQPSLLGMMIRGVRVNLDLKKTLGQEFHHKAEFHRMGTYEAAGKEFNLNSWQQKSAILYGQFGLKIQYNNKTKKPTTDKDALQRLKGLYPDLPILEHLLQYSKFNKLAENYADMIVESDGRVRTSYGLISTWRLSSSQSHFGGGGNLQNIPKRTEEGYLVRRLFIPDSWDEDPPKPFEEIREDVRLLAGDKVADKMRSGEKILVACDLSQAEARVVAWEAEDLERIDLFESGWDVHWHNASRIFSIPPDFDYHENPMAKFRDPITDQEHTLKALRNIGKTVVHAGNYGMGPKMLQTILAREGVLLPFMKCRKLLLTHKTRNPLLLEWQRRIREEIKATRMLVSSGGRIRYFMGRMGDSTFKAAYAFSPQNTVGEMLEEAIQDIDDNLPWFQNLLNVHDEVVGQIHPWDLGKTIPAVRKYMERPLEINRRTLTIPCDFSVGTSWGELEEIDL